MPGVKRKAEEVEAEVEEEWKSSALKEKKAAAKKVLESSLGDEADEGKRKKKKSKKDDEDGEKQKKKKSKKSKNSSSSSSASSSEDEGVGKGANAVQQDDIRSEGDIRNFPLNPNTVRSLQERNIKELFPIQIQTFHPVFEGKDVIAQARTGSGKTLAFSLPIIERILKENTNAKKPYGRAPVALVMAPTRELAIQIDKEILTVYKTQGISTVCIYGGSSYEMQEAALRRGVDVVIGTPGRILDLMHRETLNLTQLKYVILDEADRMLEVGFAEAIDEILGSLYVNEFHPQTLLFSATMPRWVRETSRKYLKRDKINIDLVSNQNNKTAETIQHLAIRCPWQERNATLRDVIQVYSGAHGRTMVFTQTKNEANELALKAGIKQESQPLHGDIPQKQREITLEAFRKGTVKVLIATDVAARGIDIPEVDLVIQTEPPERCDDYIHRSGRTGRAGKSGVCIVFYKPTQEELLKNIENRSGIRFKRIGAPQPDEIIRSSAKDVIAFLSKVPENTLEYFRSAAEELITEKGAVDAVAAALAHISGNTEIKARSLLNSNEGYITYLMKITYAIRSPAFIWGTIERTFSPEFKQAIRGLRLTKDKEGAVFDIPQENQKMVEELWKDTSTISLAPATELPEFDERPFDSQSNTQSPGRNNFGNRGGRFSGGGGNNGYRRSSGGFRR